MRILTIVFKMGVKEEEGVVVVVMGHSVGFMIKVLKDYVF